MLCSCPSIAARTMISLIQMLAMDVLNNAEQEFYRDMAYISQFWPGVSAVIRVDSLRYDKSNDEYKGLETRFYSVCHFYNRGIIFGRSIAQRDCLFHHVTECIIFV